ncbi:MAG TPA: hypothetical protein VGC01_05235 [Mucilaginibacter sp.]
MLSIKPCCSDSDCQEKITVKKERSTPASHKEKECQGCSPFFTCGTCVGFILAKPFILNPKLISETPVKNYIAYQQPYFQEVLLAIWQPPQLG